MLRSFEDLQFIESTSQSLEIDFGAQSKMVKMVLDFQALQFEHGIQSRKNMIVLRSYSPNRCFA